MTSAATVSTILADLPRSMPPEPRLRDLMDVLGERGFGLTLAVAAVPAVIPTPGLPAGVVFGTVLTLIALAMIAGGREARLPDWLGRLPLNRAALEILDRRGVPLVRWLERRASERLHGLVGEMATPWLGIVVAVMGILIALPIPFGNTVPGFSVLLIGLGLSLRDGGAVAAGLVTGFVGVLISVVLILLSYKAIQFILA